MTLLWQKYRSGSVDIPRIVVEETKQNNNDVIFGLQEKRETYCSAVVICKRPCLLRWLSRRSLLDNVTESLPTARENKSGQDWNCCSNPYLRIQTDVGRTNEHWYNSWRLSELDGYRDAAAEISHTCELRPWIWPILRECTTGERFLDQWSSIQKYQII